MLADYHLHSCFSGDSSANPEDIIKKAVSLGMTRICFTDHNDFDFPGDIDFSLDTDSYFSRLSILKERYQSQIHIGIGMEAGLEPCFADKTKKLVNSYPFDFVIGSSHLVHRKDPYYPDFFLNRKEKDCFSEYFLSILENLKSYQDFDVYGHLDYIVRYAPLKDQNYSYMDFSDIFDQILKTLISGGKGIEVNSGGLRNGFSFPNPHPDIIHRYRELGGEIITVGSDAHVPEHIGYQFNFIKELVKACGFSYYTVFENRRPVFLPL